MSLEVRLLGELQVHGQSGPLDISARKARALLCHLAERAGRPQPREQLSRLLWGDISSDEHARKSLRQALSVLRRALPEGSLVATREHVSLDLGQVDIDLRQFERLARQDDRGSLQAAVTLYRGDFLEGFTSGSDAFDDWVAHTRRELRERAIGALGRLLSLQREVGDAEGATATAIRCLSLDPLREDLHRALMSAYVEQGRLGDALEQFEQCRRLLHRELGVAPAPATRELLARLRSRARQVPTARAESPSSSGATPPQLRLVAVLAAQLHDGPPARQPAAASFEALARAVVDQGGEILRHGPVSLVAAFGAAGTRGTEPLRALRAARACLAPVEHVEHIEHATAVALGLAYGEVMVALDAGRREVVGGALAHAADLASQAQAGRALACDSLQRALRDRPGAAVEFEPTRLRGGERCFGVGFLPPEREPSLPFVGRLRELAVLRAALDSCQRQARGEMLVIRGEAGIGKTRLLEQMLALAIGQGYDVHHVSATDFGPHWQRDVIAALTRSALGCESAERESVEARVVERFGALEGQQALALLGSPACDGLPETDSGVERQARLARRQRLWRSLWQGRLAAGPVLVALEDLHWVAAPERVFLAELGALCSSGPLLFVTTTRPDAAEQHADWRGALRGRPVTTLDVGPLSELEASDLALQLGAAAGERIDVAIRRSEGHPLFLEQLLRAEPAAALPESVQAVVQSRLDALEPTTADTLRAASVLGQHFDPEMLSALVDRDVQLEVLIGEGLLRGSGASFGFSHALVRDAVYATLLTSLRGDLHRRAAELTAHGDPALSAEHWERAEDERAGRAYLLAARHAASSDRLREAVQLCERGLLWAVDTDCRFELCLARAELLGRSAEPERAESAAREVLSLATTTSQRARAWLALAEALRGTLRDDGALCALDAAEQLTPKSDHQSRAQIHYLRGSVLFPRARGAQSLECHEQALEHARLAGSTAAQARALSGIGDAHYIQGRMLSARDNFERSIELSTREGLRRLVDVNRVMVAITTLYHLDLADADRVMRGIALSAAESCDLGLESLAWSSLALIPRSDAVQAEADLQRAIELSQRTGRVRLGIVPQALLVEAQASRTPSLESAALLNALYERCVGSERSFCGLSVLGLMLSFADTQARRCELLEEAERLLSHGAFVGHGLFMFTRSAISDCLERSDLDGAQRYAELLERYNPDEALPWTRFFCAWAAALIEWQRGVRGTPQRQALATTAEWAERAGLIAEAMRCRQALRD